ncbi:MAG: toll/interleukin-1 receptor domain-containing protein [Candidatus Thiodiazotropha taylori]|nr:toll/interleukin-1 receptor domain-containing protein [Candidatus Thiodiazotropha taylori]
MAERNALFISHANPEDNDFTLWLGTKLSAMGYEVWADVLRLRGGEDWQRKLEAALRNKAIKVLLVANEKSIGKQGVRNEIQIASDISKKIADSEFIIPLRTSNYDSPFLIAHAQYIDFKRSWSKGLVELMEVLSEKGVQKVDASKSSNTLDSWRHAHLHMSKSIVGEPERLISNWLEITSLPENIYYYDFEVGISIRTKDLALQVRALPLVPFNRGFIGFNSKQEYEQILGDNLPIVLRSKMKLSSFLENGWPSQCIKWIDANNLSNNLLRQGLEIFLDGHSLYFTEMANNQLAWWWPRADENKGMISFSWNNGPRGRRQVIGELEMGNVHWHYGISFAIHTRPFPHITLKSRVIFTKDGSEPIGNTDYMFQLRRSKTKSWRNARWRDMMLAFLYHLLKGKSELQIPFGQDASMTAAIPPIMMEAPITVKEMDEEEGGASVEEDVIEFDDLDDDADEISIFEQDRQE